LGLLATLFLLSLPAFARINVVTLPDRDFVQLTIYNSVDLTLVKETRVLIFRKGINRLEFSWANTLIDPTSVEFRPLTHADQVEVLDISFPPRVSNTLEWRINSELAGEVTVEIRYFTSGISWAADYVAEANKNEQVMGLAGYVKVNNNSGEDYENAQVRLVVGVVRLLDAIADLAGGKRDADKERLLLRYGVNPPPAAAPPAGRAGGRGGRGGGGGGGGFGGGMAVALAEAEARPKEVVKEELGEYFLYTVEGRETIPTGWSKRLRSFQTNDVPIVSYYKFERERWGDQVLRNYRFTNSTPSRLGSVPLPDGSVKAFRTVTPDNLYAYVGATQVKYIPINEFVELELGNDREVLVKPILTNWVKTDIAFDQNNNVKGWTTKETWEIEVQNSKDIPVVLDIRRNFAGDWTMATDATYTKMDANKVKFLVPLQPREKRKFSYELTTRLGTNATR
jgi:hypothetical protein